MIGRHRPVRIKTVNLQPARIYLRGKEADALNDVFYGQADHDDREKIRDIAEDAFQDILYGIPDIIGDLIRQFFCLREDGEKDRYR